MPRSNPLANQDTHPYVHNSAADHRHHHYRDNSSNSHDYQYPGHSHSHGHSRPGSYQQPRQRFPAPEYESGVIKEVSSDLSLPPADMAERTNTELNLTVLKRYLPGITNILSIAANAVVYTFQHPSEWKKTTTEGTMFICSQRKSPEEGESGCLFILNRKGLRNVILDLDNVGDFELSGDLLIFKLDYAANEVQLESGETVAPLVLGLWTYAEDKSDRETNAALVYKMWSQVCEARARDDASDPGTSPPTAETGAAVQATGRRLSVTDLFSAYNGNTLPAQTP
ncbi:PH domain-like protein [Xylaria intraflava]|nr:PH domain-like protein [Xylaria intraflava]